MGNWPIRLQWPLHDLLVECQTLEPAQLARDYFALEEQLSQSIGATVDLVMASALRNPIVRAEVESSKQLMYAA